MGIFDISSIIEYLIAILLGILIGILLPVWVQTILLEKGKKKLF
ncbi:MAG: hypothetical protein Q6362_010445 [Candidatus Wukongarchaeota archaeon]|nr:hypothetical protein [Candidatus Wukongarchaeota archaeon]MDO8129832.1 hypothetical protein [Candidatus Wukongarchaeota archaeon]